MKVLFWCTLWTLVVGQIHETGQLTVVSPSSLASRWPNGTIPMKPAMFGIPAHGHQSSLSGLVVYVPTDDVDGCNPIDTSEIQLPAGQLAIFVVERGTCTFVTKVQHAQDAGAGACIIVDNKDEANLPYMADDGHGSSLSIPSMLIHKNDGAPIKAATDANDMVILRMAWNLPHPDNIVEWQLWTSSDEDVDAQFKKDFDEAAKVLGSASVFTPHFTVEDGVYLRCYQADPSKPLPCDDSCTNSGRYCALNAASDPQKGMSGAAVIAENLRQMCIFKIVNTTNPLEWWNYVELFESNCVGTQFTKACSESVMKMDGVGVTPADVQKCVDDSGGVDPLGGANTILDEEMNLRYALAMWFTPTVLINGVPYRGSLQCPQPVDFTTCGVLEELCLGFKNPEQIPACESSPGCPLGQSRDVCQICGGQGHDACGGCTQPGSSDYNKACLGCDGVAGSGAVMDNCGWCGGPGRDICGDCKKLNDPTRQDGDDSSVCDQDIKKPPNDQPQANTVGSGAVIAIVIILVVVVGAGVFLYIKHRQRVIKQDIDDLLKQYLPMEGGNGENLRTDSEE